MRSRFHHNDIVEEIATRRQGRIEAVSRYIVEGREVPPHQYRVAFLDGTEPRLRDFTKEEDLRLVRCPHIDPRQPQ
jgi:hypothetical protein